MEVEVDEGLRSLLLFLTDFELTAAAEAGGESEVSTSSAWSGRCDRLREGVLGPGAVVDAADDADDAGTDAAAAIASCAESEGGGGGGGGPAEAAAGADFSSSSSSIVVEARMGGEATAGAVG